MVRIIQLSVACVAVLVATAGQVQAIVIVETPGPYSSFAGRPTTTPSIGILARVDVGASNVAINQLSVFGDALSDVNLKWTIFTGSNGTSPLFQTQNVGVSAVGPAQWIDSPVFPSFNLLANQTYWIGAAVDGPIESFRSYYNLVGVATSISNGGLTLPAGVNGNIRTSFANPTLGATPAGTVQSAIRLSRLDISAVPEPTSLAIWGVGALGMGLVTRRRLNSI